MRLRYLVIHCTATPAGMDVTADMIRRWHTSPVSKGGRGWTRKPVITSSKISKQLVRTRFG